MSGSGSGGGGGRRSDAEDERSLRTRIEDRVRASTMRELTWLRRRMSVVEEAVAENRALRPGLDRMIAEVEAEVAQLRRSGRRGLAHPPPRHTGR